jgi:hypothetical protein
MISAWLSQGVTSWYQSRLPIGSPLSNSLVEVESSVWKTFTNIVVWLTSPHHKWVVLGSFIPRLYSGIIFSILFRLKILLTLTLGSFNYFLLEGPSFQMVAYFTRILRRYSSLFPETLVPTAFAIPYHRQVHMDNYIHLPFIQSFPVDLVITR